MLLSSQLSGDVGMDEIHDSREVVGASYAQEKGAMVGEVGISIEGEFVLLLSFAEDSENQASAASAGPHEIAPLDGADGDFSDGDGVAIIVCPKLGCVGNETKRARH
jgi:hypothetical protein